MAMGISAAIGPAIQAGMGIYGMFNRDAEDRRQVKQQQKFTDMQAEANKEAATYSSQLQYDMWKKTNYSAQIEEMEKAGLNPAMMYGGSGGGGATTGSASQSGVSSGQAASAAATEQNKMMMGMQLAQAGLIAAQTEKTKAETENIEAGTTKTGVDTEGARENVTAQKFQNEVQRLIGTGRYAQNYDTATDKLEIEASRANAEWEAYQAAGFKGKTFNDPNSPLAKALSAGWEKAITDLSNAKKDGDLKTAQTAVETYKANLAKQGISPDSPWYIKILGDMMEKVGMPLTKGVEAVKTVTQ